MKIIITFIIIVLFNNFVVNGKPNKLMNVKVLSLDQKKTKLKYLDTLHKPIVFIFISEDCPICRYQIHNLNLLNDKYDEKILFVGIFPNSNTSFKKIDSISKYFNIKYPIYIDYRKKLTKKLKATITPEAFLLSIEKKVVYSGQIDDKYVGIGEEKIETTTNYLIESIESLIHNKPIKITHTDAIGCFIY